VLVWIHSSGVCELGKTLEELSNGVGSFLDPPLPVLVFMQTVHQVLYGGFNRSRTRPFTLLEFELPLQPLYSELELIQLDPI
jgi:hypothetical protein